MLSDLLHRLEVHLAHGLGADARAIERNEATARLLLVLDGTTRLAMQEVAGRLGRDPTTATRFVDRAERDGLVERTAGTADRRQRMVALTEEGQRLRDALLATREERTARLADAVLADTGLGEGQIEWFLSALVKAAEEDRPG